MSCVRHRGLQGHGLMSWEWCTTTVGLYHELASCIGGERRGDVTGSCSSAASPNHLLTQEKLLLHHDETERQFAFSFSSWAWHHDPSGLL